LDLGGEKFLSMTAEFCYREIYVGFFLGFWVFGFLGFFVLFCAFWVFVLFTPEDAFTKENRLKPVLLETK